MRKEIFIAFFISVFSVALAEEPCNGKDFYHGKGVGKNEKEAETAANLDIAQQRSSTLEAVSKYSLYLEEEGGSIERDKNIFSQMVKQNISEINVHDTKPLKQTECTTDDAKTICKAERYMCYSTAAKPFLNSLMRLNDKLDVFANKKADKESCKAITETYYNIKDLEDVLENLGQMDSAIKSKYERVYTKAKEKCRKEQKENRSVNTRRAFLVPGLAQWRNGYPVSGVIIGLAEVATLAVGGVYTWKAIDSRDEADASRKKAHSPLGDNKEDFDKYMGDAKKHDSDFKTERGIAIGMFGAFFAIYAINVVTGIYTGGNSASLTPTISPNGEIAGLYWTMNF